MNSLDLELPSGSLVLLSSFLFPFLGWLNLFFCLGRPAGLVFPVESSRSLFLLAPSFFPFPFPSFLRHSEGRIMMMRG